MIGKSRIIITKTPFRVNFFGGGTDLPDYFNKNQGAVLGTTINKYSYVTINSLDRLTEKKIRMSYSKLEMVDSPEELQHDIARAALLEYKGSLEDVFLDIHSYADLPSGTGVGSSSSFTVGFLNALHLLRDKYPRPKQLAKEAIRIERDILAEAGGWQDQIHASYGGFNKVEFYNNNFDVTPLYLTNEKSNALQSSLMFYFTGQTRSSAKVHSQISSETESKLDKQTYLKKMYEQVKTAESIIKDTNNSDEMIREFGQLLDEGWQLKRSLSEKISNSMIDEVYNVAKKNGAFGGKLLGAGGGGFLVFMVPEKSKADVANALSALKKIDIEFDRQGSQLIFSN